MAPARLSRQRDNIWCPWFYLKIELFRLLPRVSTSISTPRRPQTLSLEPVFLSIWITIFCAVARNRTRRSMNGRQSTQKRMSHEPVNSTPPVWKSRGLGGDLGCCRTIDDCSRPWTMNRRSGQATQHLVRPTMMPCIESFHHIISFISIIEPPEPERIKSNLSSCHRLDSIKKSKYQRAKTRSYITNSVA
jgi:hypothetical protein